MESLGGEVFENLFVCVCACTNRFFSLPFGPHVHQNIIYSSVPKHTHPDMFTVTLEWNTCARTKTHGCLLQI